jgi:putative transposase
MARTKPREVSDEVWERVRPLIPAAPSHAKGGRRRMDNRKACEAIVYVLRTGIQWNALPRELGASSTVHDRFQEWERAGLFKALWQAGLSEYDDLKGIQWEWQAVDGVMTKAPDLWRRDRSHPHGSRQTGNQTESVDGWSGNAFGPGRGGSQSS